jgi:hypothetical protein
VPKLVCVGIRGWLNDSIFAKLASSAELIDRVVMLSGVPDRELAILYQGCLFTLFPSCYEGWGLPVTESLCFGKVPVVSHSSSLPEAGGEFADYFDLGDGDQLIDVLERLIFDPEYRRERESLIQRKYHPRSWENVGDEITGALGKWEHQAEKGEHDRVLVPPVVLGRYYPISRNTETRIFRSMISGEIFRTGDAWWGCDDWGCWTKPTPARMSIRTVEGEGPYRLYLGLCGVPEKDTPFDVMVSNCPIVRGIVKHTKTKWLSFDLELIDNPVIDVVLQGYETSTSTPRADEEPRTVALGVIGFMLCNRDNAVARADFVEAVALDNLDCLAKKAPAPG